MVPPGISIHRPDCHFAPFLSKNPACLVQQFMGRLLITRLKSTDAPDPAIVPFRHTLPPKTELPATLEFERRLGSIF
jgi:hypothetical protein